MIRNSKGLTLIELIIVIAIASVVVMIGFSIFSFGLRSFNTQTATVNNQSNIRQAIRVISQEIRKSNAQDITTSPSKININGVVYRLQDSTLLKNDLEFIYGIESFNPIKDGNRITVEIVSQSKKGKKIRVISEIYVRE